VGLVVEAVLCSDGGGEAVLGSDGGGKAWCRGRMYSEGNVDIFDMVDINLFTVVALKMMIVQLGHIGKSEPLFNYYLRPLTSLDEGLYALACEDDNRPPPQFRATIIEEIIDKPRSNVAIEHRSEKMLLFTWHDSSEPTTELVCDSVTPKSLTPHDSSTPLTAIQVIEDVMGQLSSEETELDGEASFSDVAGSGIENFGLSHDESFGVDDLNLNLNEHVGLNVSQIETQSELHVSEEPDVEVRTHEPSVEEVRTQEPIMKEVIVEDYVSSGEDVEHGIGQEDESAPSDEQFFYDVEGIYIAYETKYEGQSSEDAGKDDDDDEDDYFLVCICLVLAWMFFLECLSLPLVQ
ncbi:hypothetical protein Tco_1257180, partial [Tanacetum coccineum]